KLPKGRVTARPISRDQDDPGAHFGQGYRRNLANAGCTPGDDNILALHGRSLLLTDSTLIEQVGTRRSGARRFSGLLTFVEIGHSPIGSAWNGLIKPLGPGRH